MLVLLRTVRDRIADLRLRRAVDRLNRIAGEFGFPVMTREQWERGLARLAPVVKQCGLTVAEANESFRRFATLSGPRADPELEVAKAWIAAEREIRSAK